MGILGYGMINSLDGYVIGPDGRFDWAEPDAEVHRFVNDQDRGIGTYLYGRRMWQTMKVWGEDDWLDGEPDVVQDYAQLWRASDKIVFSTTLESVDEPRARLERSLDIDAIRQLKESTDADLAVAGPTLAAHLLPAGLVDELSIYLAPVVVGGGVRLLPEVALHLDLLDERRFDSGFVFLRYRIRT
ncbi:MAG: dihydrofolate reductase family protein [Micropruina sp.]|uniref:dihydrofolate reductase family protein n=1 Tax=Micropruina sp. TaxID=2737536 RepID=UPI0039E354BC